MRREFARASRPYLASPASWLTWAVLLPAAALLTPAAIGASGEIGVLLLWSVTILVGGAVEALVIRRQREGWGSTSLAGWALRSQGNLSLVAVALSVFLVWRGLASALPGLWLLLLGHSFFMLGGLAFPPFRTSGLLYQLGGLAALVPGVAPLPVFAAATAAGNLWMAWSIARRRRREP